MSSLASSIPLASDEREGYDILEYTQGDNTTLNPGRLTLNANF